MANNDVELKVGVDTSSAEKTLGNFRSSSEKNLSAIENSFGKLRTAAIVAVSAFAAKNVFDFFKGGVDAAIGAEVAFVKMSKALELSGNAAPGAADTFDQLATNIEKVTGISAEAIQEQIGIAQAFELTNEQTQKLIIAATELSAATGEDLATSVRNLGNTFNGTIGTLKKTVPELQRLDDSALKAGAAIDFVINRFSGSAAKNLETFAGASQQAAIAFGKIPEEFGKVIVENVNLRKAIENITSVFYGLVDIVNQNKDGISNLVTVALDPLMGAFSAVVRIAGVFNNAINGIQLTVASLGKVFLDLVSFMKDFDATVAKMTFGGRNYDQARASADEAKQSALEYTHALQLMNDQLIKEKKDFDNLNDSILNYKTVTSGATKSIQQLAIAEGEAKKAREKSAKDIADIESAYESLYKKVVAESATALEKEKENYKSNLEAFKRFEDSKLVTLEKLTKLRASIEKTHTFNVSEIHAKALAERNQKELNSIEAQQKKIAKIINETTIFQQIKIFLDPTSAEDLKASIKDILKQGSFTIGASAVASISNGAAGADAVSGFVTSLISKIPFIGGLIAELVKLAGLAPEKNKEAIQGFAKGIPEFLSNINTNLGSLTDILNEVIGPIIEKVLTSSGIGNLFTNLMKNIVKLPELIATIADGVAAGIKKSGGEIAIAFKIAIVDIKNEMGRFSENVRNFFGTFANQIKAVLYTVLADNPILNEMRTMVEAMKRVVIVIDFLRQLFQAVGPVLIQIRDAFARIGAEIGGAFENLGSKLSDGFNQIASAFTGLFDGLVNSIKELPNQIKAVFGNFEDGIKNALKDVFSEFFRSFDNISKKADAFFGRGKINAGGVGGSGKKGPVTGIAGSPLATGITEVPAGFKNDTFAARLSSGERVVDTNANADLKEFLANSKSGGLGSDQAMALLSQIASGQGQRISIELTLDKRVLSQTILDLNRRNERLA